MSFPLLPTRRAINALQTPLIKILQFVHRQKDGRTILDHVRQESAFSPKASFDLHDINLRRKNDPLEYTKWLEEEPRREAFALRHGHFLDQGVYKELVENRVRLELLAHVEAIENLLGHSFNSYEDLLLLLPRFPRVLSDYKVAGVSKGQTLAMLGKSVVELYTHETHNERDRELIFLLLYNQARRFEY